MYEQWTAASKRRISKLQLLNCSQGLRPPDQPCCYAFPIKAPPFRGLFIRGLGQCISQATLMRISYQGVLKLFFSTLTQYSVLFHTYYFLLLLPPNLQVHKQQEPFVWSSLSSEMNLPTWWYLWPSPGVFPWKMEHCANQLFLLFSLLPYFQGKWLNVWLLFHLSFLS